MKIKDIVDKRLSSLQPKWVTQQGVLGNLATGVVEVPGKTAMVYVTLNSGLLIPNVLNIRVPNLLGLQVSIGFDPNNQSRTLQVLGARDLNYFGVDNPSNGPVFHHSQHEWPYPDTVYVWGEQFLDRLFVPAPGTLTVNIYPGTYPITGSFKHFTQVTNIDLTTLVGTVTIGNALWAVIVVDEAGDFQIRSGALVAEQATPFVSAYLMLADTDLPVLTDGDTPICAVRLYYSQMEFFCNGQQNDFVDLRFAKAGGGGGTGGAGGHVIEDGTSTPMAAEPDLQFTGKARVSDDGGVRTIVDIPAPFVGTSPPDSPEDGDLWWDPDDTGDGGSVIGKGDPGEQGIQGIQGPEGPEGPEGPDGPAGANIMHSQIIFTVRGVNMAPLQQGIYRQKICLPYVGAGATIEEVYALVDIEPGYLDLRFDIHCNGYTIFGDTTYMAIPFGEKTISKTGTWANSGAVFKDDEFQLELVQGDSYASDFTVHVRYKWAMTDV